MSYASWTQAVEACQGVEQFKSLHPTLQNETADVHPFFTRQMVLAEQIVDAVLDAAGYVTPVATPLEDVRLTYATIGTFVDKVTEGKSNREPWMDRLAGAAKEFLDGLADGSLVLIGGESAAVESGRGSVIVSHREQSVFDLGDPDSRLSTYFPQLGRPRGWHHH